jgi:ATP-binding cassette subfamily F protein uup
VALVGVNGSGKTTLLRVLAGALAPDTGTVDRGATVRLAYLAQDALGPAAPATAGGAPAAPAAAGGAPVAPAAAGGAPAAADLAGDQRVLESLEAIKRVARLGDGRELTAGALAERFGFRGDRARTLVRELSGGERRRLQLMRLLMGEPNVLLLDEPTNDLDIDTLTALEDLLDGWPGTLVVVSHDRYFVERVCDDVYALSDRGIRHLPGGIDQYVAERRAASEPPPAPRRAASAPPAQAVIRAARKEAARLERALERLGSREAALHSAMAEAATDHVRLAELQAELGVVAAEREALEAAWLEAAEALEG